MKFQKLDNFIKGWFIGDFEPTLKKTKDFEIGVKRYKSGDHEKKHYHKIADEFTVIISGKFKMGGKECREGDVIHIQPGEIVDFECLETGANVVVKIPSVKGDKYEV